MKIYILPFWFIFVFSTVSCIEEYIPSGIETMDNMLVIDGMITNNESIFHLSKSMGVNDSTIRGEIKHPVNNATVFIETNDGQQFPGVFTREGGYTIPTGDLSADTQYRLFVSLDNKEYASEYLTPIFTPEIDTIEAMKKGDGEPVTIHVSIHDPKDQSNYYLWSFDEHWEVRAEMFASHDYIDGELVRFDSYRAPNNYYCWGKDFSRKILLGSSEKLAENIIYQQKVTEIPCNDDKISRLYYIDVAQKQIRKEAYDYLKNKEDNNNRSGSIFGPVLSEMNGNITCLTNPEESVIGYIEVATTTHKGVFVDGEGLYESDPTKLRWCQEWTFPFLINETYAILIYGESYAPRSCVDCRLKYKATKNKPNFWPTDVS
jgi:hypothetical protein